MGFKENFYSNFPKAEKGTNYMDLDFLTRKERKVALNTVVHFYRKIKTPESRYAEFSFVISKACRHINAKVMDEQDIQTFVTLAGTLDKAVKNGIVVDKKNQFADIQPVLAKIREAGANHYGHKF